MKRMQGVSAYITYLKAKDVRRHKSRCIYNQKDGCKLYGECRGSSHCRRYKEVGSKKDKRTKKVKSDANKKNHNTIRQGNTVKVLDKENEILMTFKLVEQQDSNIENGKMSIQSPLGKALLGKKKGDIVEIFIDKKRKYRIINHNIR